jgi:hypothetical protein
MKSRPAFLLKTRVLIDDSSDDSSAYYSDRASSPTQPTERKSKVLDDIIDKLGLIDEVLYTPFQYEPPRDLIPLLPNSFPLKPRPFDYFSLFFTPDLFQTITKNTNRYASIYRFQVQQERAREWTDLLIEEFYVFIGAIIYIGVYYEP